jgi:hypothetical protein
MFTRILLAALVCIVGQTVLAAESIRFNRDIRPILASRCFSCHGPDGNHREADLRLDVASGALADLGGHAAVVPGKPDESELIRRIVATDDTRMPPAENDEPLTAAEVDLLKRWIADGARFELHWTLQPRRRPPPPKVAGDWARNAIDQFVLRQLQDRKLSPAGEADRATLLRRLSFDIRGLPPSWDDAQHFQRARESEEAYAEFVDRYLDSPAFGERMAMFWLDLVRYADTVGYHGDQEHAAGPYRDYVIDSFNQNKPFDQFTIEQLAGDLLEKPTPEQLIATCYNRLLQTTHEGGAQDKEYRTKYAADRVRNFSMVWMGTTMGCTECHEHKYDPYSQKNFYQLAAFFADIKERGNFGSASRAPEMAVRLSDDRRTLIALQRELERVRKLLQEAKTDKQADVDKLQEDVAELIGRIATVEKRTYQVMVTEAVEPRLVRVLKRGDWMDETGEIVTPGTPESLPPLGVVGRRANRLDLARWITSPDHPQTARVFVNRLWSLYFGGGICSSLDDTGSQGAWPTHPDLLDYLADELIANGWNVKHLVRQIVMSRTYRQSSLEPAALRELDPANRLLARQSRFRLPAEMIRDNALAVSGLLIDRRGGASSRPYQPAGYYRYLNFPKRSYKSDQNDNQYRRGVYMHWQRQFLHPMLRAFDAPSREECTARRPTSNTPLAALTMLNDPTFVEAARALGDRIVKRSGSIEERVRWSWRQVLGRTPNEAEIAVLVAVQRDAESYYVAHPDDAKRLLSVGMWRSQSEAEPHVLAAWTTVARGLLNLNETITRN